MTMGQQDGGRLQPMLGEERVELVDHSDSRVDHDTLLPRRGRDHVAVGAEGIRGKPGDEHVRSPPVDVGVPRSLSAGRVQHRVAHTDYLLHHILSR